MAGAKDGGPNEDNKTPTKKRAADGTGKKVQQRLFVSAKTPAAEKPNDGTVSATLTDEQGNKSPSDARVEVPRAEDGGPNEDDKTPTKKRAAYGTGKTVQQRLFASALKNMQCKPKARFATDGSQGTAPSATKKRVQSVVEC